MCVSKTTAILALVASSTFPSSVAAAQHERYLRLGGQAARNAVERNKYGVAYKYNWLATAGKCAIPLPSPTLSCSGGPAEIVSASATCKVNENNSGDISCEPKAEGTVTFRCIGDDDQADFQAAATLPAATTSCGGLCNDFITTTCGWAKQSATLETLCGDDQDPVRQTEQADGSCYSEYTTTAPCTTRLDEVKITSNPMAACVTQLAVCGDGRCDPEEDSGVCPEDCPPRCGDGICNPGEDHSSCAQDCVPGDKYAHYAFAWTAHHDKPGYECKEPGPAPQMKCSGNGSIQIIKSAHENHNCTIKEDDSSAVSCRPQPDVGNIAFRCYGSDLEDLKLTVTLKEVSTRCNGMGRYPYLYASGYAKQLGLLGTLCGQGEGQKLLNMEEKDCPASTELVNNGANLVCYNDKWCKARWIMASYCSITLEDLVITTTRDLVANDCIYSRQRNES